MNLEDLKQSWAHHKEALASNHVDQFVRRSVARSSLFEKTIAGRDFKEYIAIVLAFVFFAPELFNESLVVKSGVLIIILGSVLIGLVLYWSGKGRPAQNDLSVTDFCKEQLLRVDRQIWMLKNIGWWYLGPLMLGCSVFVIGLLPGHSFSWILVGAFGLVAFYIYRANQNAVRTELIPYRNELKQTLKQFDPNSNKKFLSMDNDSNGLMTSSEPVDHEQVAAFIERVANENCEKALAGIAIGVIVDGEEISAVSGWADVESKTPITESTIFEIGSLSKLFTSLLLAVAVKKQEVNLDEPVQSALGEDVTLPTDGEAQITWRSLANHRSSLPRLPEDLLKTADIENPYIHYDQDMLYGCLNQMETVKPIGSRGAYSNFGVGLLGHALGKLVGTDYRASLKERVLLPLEMLNTSAESCEKQTAHLATAHMKKDNPTKHWGFSEVTVAAGGIRSSLADMFKFLHANINPSKTKLADELILMRQPSKLPKCEGSRAWFVPDYVCSFLLAVLLIMILESFLGWKLGRTIGYWCNGICILAFMVTMRWGCYAGAASLVLLVFGAWELFGVELNWVVTFIWGGALMYIANAWKSELEKRGGGEGRLAWQISKIGSRPCLWHNGMVGGSASFLGIIEDLDVGVVVLTNTSTVVDSIGLEILSELIRLKEDDIGDSVEMDDGENKEFDSDE